MAKYFSTQVLTLTTFPQENKNENLNNFIQYLNIFFLITSISSLFLHNYTDHHIIINPIIEHKQIKQHSIDLHLLSPLKEEEISRFILDTLHQLFIMKENNAIVDVKRNKSGIATDIIITNVTNYLNLKNLFNKIQYDNNILVQIL
jgi:hypothetical protein